MRTIIVLVLVMLLGSCSVPREFQYEDRMLTKRQFDRKIKKINKEFVKGMTEEEVSIFLNLQVVYDTTGIRN